MFDPYFTNYLLDDLYLVSFLIINIGFFSELLMNSYVFFILKPIYLFLVVPGESL